MGEFALPLAIVSAGFQAFSAFSDASAQKQVARAQSQIAANNVIIAENNAKYSEQQGADAKARGLKDADALRRKLAASSAISAANSREENFLAMLSFC